MKGKLANKRYKDSSRHRAGECRSLSQVNNIKERRKNAAFFIAFNTMGDVGGFQTRRQ